MVPRLPSDGDLHTEVARIRTRDELELLTRTLGDTVESVLNHQGPLCPPDGGKGGQHDPVLHGELCGAGLVGDHPIRNLPVPSAQTLRPL